MEVVINNDNGDLYKNGQKFPRYNIENSSSTNYESNPDSNSKEGFSFHAKTSDARDAEVLIAKASNEQPAKQSNTPLSDFKYHASDDVEYEVVTNLSNNDTISVRSDASPNNNQCVDKSRKVEHCDQQTKSQNSKPISLSSLNEIKPPTRPTNRQIFKKVGISHNSKDVNQFKSEENKTVRTSPEKKEVQKKVVGDPTRLENRTHHNISGSNSITNTQKTASPKTKRGILKKSSLPRKENHEEKTNKKIEEIEDTDNNENRIIFQGTDVQIASDQPAAINASKDRTENESSSTQPFDPPSEEDPNAYQQQQQQVKEDGPDEKVPPSKQSSTTRLPPAGKNSSLVGNGDISHRRPPPAKQTNNPKDKPNVDVTQRNRKNSNDKRLADKHVSTIHKNDVAVSQSSRIHVADKSGESDRMSIGSRSSNRTKPAVTANRILSPKTDTTEYRIANPRSKMVENGLVQSPTEKSNDSRTSSDSRGRSKEFTFRWNAPSRNTSPEVTDKSSSPPIKQFKPSAQIKSFYAYLHGRSKKRNSTSEVSTKPKQTVSSSKSELERPQSFVYLRSQTVKRSAWDTNPSELTYKPSTNGPEEISQAYIGEESIRDAEMAAKLQQMQQNPKPKENKGTNKRSKIPPWYEKEYVLNRRQASVYRNMNNTYGKQNGRLREQRFVQKLAEYEVNKAKQQWDELLEKERRKRESKEMQMLYLNEIRQRFEDEAYHRFHTQYVTSRILEHEKMNRNEYGLPEDDTDEPENKTIIKRTKVVPKSLITEDMIQDIYKKRFNKMFSVNKGNGLGRRPKTPKMEGIDTVVLEEKDNKDMERPLAYDTGKTKERKRMVKDVIDAAERQLKVNKQDRKKLSTPVDDKNKTGTPSIKDLDLDDDSDDDDMDDIFEKARKKYDLDVDD